MADDDSVSLWWVLLFVTLALGLAVGAILFVGGEVLTVVRAVNQNVETIL